MKKIIPLLIVLSVVFTGCSSDDANNQPIGDGDEFTFQKPEREPDISGTVKSMVGNEIVVSMRDMSSLPDDIKKIMPQNGGDIPTGGGGGMGMRGGGPGGPNGSGISDADRAKIRAAMENIKTEDVKVIFPVGISMGKMIVNGKERTTSEASLADVKVGSNVTVWLNQNGDQSRKIAETVMILPSRSSQQTQ